MSNRDRSLPGMVAKVSRSVPSKIAERSLWPALLPFHLIERAAFLAELVIVLGTSVVTGVVYHWIFLDYVGVLSTFVVVGLLAFVIFSAISAARGNYRPRNLVNFPRQARDAILIWAFVGLMLLGVAFSLKITEGFSRGASIAFFLIGGSSIIAWRGFAARFIARSLADGAFAERRILVIAEEGQLTSSKTLFELRRCGYNPTTIFEIKQSEIRATGITSSLRATLDDVVEASRRTEIEGLFLFMNWGHTRCIDDVLNFLRILPFPIHLVPDQNVVHFLSSPLVHVGTSWMAELKRAPLSPFERILKRAFDIVAAGFALLLLSPLMLLTALFIKLDSKGRLYFTQKRNGFNGRSFLIFKFRTMHVLEDGHIIRQATRDDPRVTRIGRWLRRMSIDELPQLFNVIAGDMSLVGPRPHAVAHDNEYQKLVANYAFRHHMKPGITGWAQVNGFRGETRTVHLMAKRVEHDLWYINNWSIWLDVRILFMTMMTTLRQPRAY